MQLSALSEAGLTTDADLLAAGWEPVLVRAPERAAGWGKTHKAPAVD